MAIDPTTLSLSSGIGVVARAAWAKAPWEALTLNAAAKAVAIQPAEFVLIGSALLVCARRRDRRVRGGLTGRVRVEANAEERKAKGVLRRRIRDFKRQFA